MSRDSTFITPVFLLSFKKIHVEYLHCAGVVGVCGNQSRGRSAQRTHQPEIPFDRLEEWSGTR